MATTKRNILFVILVCVCFLVGGFIYVASTEISKIKNTLKPSSNQEKDTSPEPTSSKDRWLVTGMDFALAQKRLTMWRYQENTSPLCIIPKDNETYHYYELDNDFFLIIWVHAPSNMVKSVSLYLQYAEHTYPRKVEDVTYFDLEHKRSGRPEVVSVSEINSGKVEVMGQLGLPLGTVCRIKGIIVEGSELGMKAYDGEKLVNVTHVEEKELTHNVMLNFACQHWSGVSSKSFEPGDQVKWAVYETGQYNGFPDEGFKFITPFTTRDHFFETFLVILKGN